MTGEDQSGKSFNVDLLIDLVVFFNQNLNTTVSESVRRRQTSISRKSQIEREDLDRSLLGDDDKDKPRLKTIGENKKYSTKIMKTSKIKKQRKKSVQKKHRKSTLQFKSQILFDKEKFEKQESFKIEFNHEELYDKFNKTLKDSLLIIRSLTRSVKRSAGSSDAVILIKLKTDKKFKFIAYEFECKFLNSEKAFGENNENYTIFYAILSALSQSMLGKYNLIDSISHYSILNPEIDFGEKEYLKDQIKFLKKTLNKNDFQKFVKMMSAILNLGNAKFQEKDCRDQIEEASKLLDIHDNSIINFFEIDELEEKMTEKRFTSQMRTLIGMIYENLVTFVITKLNDTMKEERESIDGYDALEIIDSFGFRDQNRYNNYSNENVNGYQNLVVNYFNEKLYKFFTIKRYENENQVFQSEELGDYYEDIKYVRNDETLNRIESETGLINTFNNFKLFKYLKEELSHRFDIFLKSAFEMLNRDIEQNKDKIHLISLEHYFSEIINYNLKEIFQKNKVNLEVNRKIRDIFIKSTILYDFRLNLNVTHDKNLNLMKSAFNKFFDSYKTNSVYFFRTIKILDTSNDIEFNKYLYKQFDGIDFESQIKRYKLNYPYKIIYDYFIEKFNVMNSVMIINPHLKVDYRNLVKNILTQMFGEN